MSNYIIYLVIGGFFFIISLVEKGNWHTSNAAVHLKKVTHLFLIVFLTIFIGLRDNIGGDWDSYYLLFEQIKYTDYPSYLFLSDPSYAIINKLISSLGLSVHYVNLTCAAIFSYAVTKISFRFPRPFFTISVAYGYLIPVVAMGLTRQSVSVALGMLSLIYFGERRYFNSTALMLLGISFHASAFLVIFICLINISKKITTNFLIAATVFIVVILNNGIDRAELIFYNYAEAGHESTGAIVRTGLILLSGILYFLTIRKKYRKGEFRRLFDVLFFLSFIAFVCSFIPSLSTFSDRFSHYLILLTLAAPIVNNCDRATANLTLSTISLLLISNGLFIIWIFTSKYAEYWLPYNNLIF